MQFGRKSSEFFANSATPHCSPFTVHCLLLALAILLAPGKTSAQSNFEDQSAAYRTALHYDPSLDAPLKQLVELYRKHDRLGELKSVYETHIGQYPADAGAKAVLIRIYRALSEPNAVQLVRQATTQHPEHAFLHFLQFELLAAEADGQAIQSLSKAIELEARPDRKLAWVDRLLEEADATEDRDLAEKHLKTLRETAAQDLAALHQLAGKMQTYGFHELGLETIAQAETLGPNPETNVDLQMLAAKMEAALEKAPDANTRLGDLLAKVAPDYWRRGEIMALRVQLLDSNAARESMLEQAKTRYQENEASAEAALDLVELYEAAGLRKEAAKVLTEASAKLPHVQVLETKALELLDRLGEDEKTIDYLETRLEQQPERQDLRYRMVQSLFLAGDRDAATAELQLVLQNLSSDDKITRQLDLGRFLRRMNLANDAVNVFETVVSEMPGRLDIRRELAEAYLAVGKRDSARQLARESEIGEAEIENFLDFVQFLRANDFLTEARRALETRIAADEDNLNLQLNLVGVLGRMGDQRAGTGILQKSRALADTDARYRQWLETGMAFHAEFDNSSMFFDGEQQQLLGVQGQDWSQDQIARFLALCDVGKFNKQRDRVAHLLRAQLDGGNLPDKLRIDVRRMLVKTLESDPAYVLEVESQLKLLGAEDPERADEYKLRTALIYHGNQRPDLAQPLLLETKLERVQEADLLKDAIPAFLDFRMNVAAISSLKRLTAVESTNRQHWERLLNLLAMSGQEAEFRKTARQLVTDAERLELSDDTVSALRTHLADSYWRSVARALDDERFSDVTQLLDGLERQLGIDDDRIWALWARAFVLNQLGQHDARNEVVTQLLTRARNSASEDETPLIRFPDGLAISLPAAEQVLTEPPGGMAAENDVEPELSDALALRWGFEVDPGSTIVQIEPVQDRVLILDNRRTLYCVAEDSGKLLWRRQSPSPFELQKLSQSGSGGISLGGGQGGSVVISGGGINISGGGSVTINGVTLNSQTLQQGSASVRANDSHIHRPPSFAVSRNGVAFVAETGFVRAIDALGGQIRWSTPVLATPPAGGDLNVAPPLMEIASVGDRVLGFDPQTGTAAAIDANSGKLIWTRQLGGHSQSKIRSALNSGASFGPDRMLVFGNACAILDSRTGDTLWEFSESDVKRFPLMLRRDVDEEIEQQMTLTGQQTRFIDHFSAASESARAIDSFLTYRAALVAPAVEWSAEENPRSARSAALLGRKLLLMSESGVTAHSLDLPLAGQTHAVRGIYLGGTGSRACFLNEAEITILDLADGTRRQISVGSSDPKTEGRIEAFVHGHRVYASSAAGIRCWNLHTGRRIFHQPWPGAFVKYANKLAGFRSPAGAESFWQGVATTTQSSAAFSAQVCYPVRSMARNGLLLVLVGDGSIAAFGERRELAVR